MKNLIWRLPTTNDEANRRAGGRRRYNAERQRKAKQRLEIVLNLWWAGHSQADIARRLGVHPSTVSRDLKPFKKMPFWGGLPPARYYRYSYSATYESGKGWRVK